MRRWILILLSLGILLISGCFSSGSSTSSSSYMSGTEGITMQFVQNNPPSVIYLDRSFAEDTPVEVEAFNRGTSPAGSIETFFTGFDEAIVSIPDLSGIDFSSQDSYKTRYNPEGGYSADSSQISVQDLGNADTYEFNLKLVYCYNYVSRVAVGICVDPNPNRVNKDDACTPGTVSTNGQGAPIGVSGIEQTPMPGNVRLKINVKHYGQGEVLRSNAQCKGIPLREDEDYVEFSVPTLAGISGSCTTQSPLKLRNGQASIICNFPLERDESSYDTILEMEIFNYKIKDSIQKSIKIINEEDTLI